MLNFPILKNMSSIPIRLESKAETCYISFSYCDFLYTKIKKRFMKNNRFCDHYYNSEDIPHFVLYYRNKPLPNKPISYLDLNIHANDTIRLEYIGLYGGSSNHHNFPSLGSNLDFIDRLGSFVTLSSPIQFSFTIYQVALLFGCDLLDNGLVPNPRGGIYVYSELDLWLPKSLWNQSILNQNLRFRYKEFDEYVSSNDEFVLQWPEADYYSSDSDSYSEQSGQFPMRTQMYLYKFIKSYPNLNKDYIVKLIEDLLILVDGLYDCYKEDFNLQKIVKVIIIFLKLRSNHSILTMFEDSKILDYINSLVVSSTEESGFLDTLDKAQNIVSALKSGKKLKVFKTLYRLGMFAMSLSLFDSVGLSLDLLGYSAFDKELLRRKNELTGDTMLDLADGIIFLLKKGYQIILTGKVDCIYHTDDEYGQLYDDIADLKLKKVALGNPEALGFNEFWYGDKLDETMQKLRNIIKFAGNLDKSEIRYWRSQLCELEMIKNNILIFKNCSESRECPFSVLFFASPGVGKSTLTKMTFQHLAKTHDLPTDDKFMYLRNPMAKHADGFRSEMHTYLMDDISFKHPAANPSGDVSLDEVYMLHGTFQYVPDQAALEDKGRIPARIKFLLGTTNVKDLNAYHYFSVPSAMQRRFPYIVEVKVKPRYQMSDNSGMLDAAKADCLPEDYPDYWILKVSKIIVPKNMGELAKTKHIATFHDINDYTAWLSKTSKTHFENEKVMTTSFKNMRNVEICKTCFKNIKFCNCSTEQSGEIVEVVLTGAMYYFALFVYFFYRAMGAVLYERAYWYTRQKCESWLARFNMNDVNEFVRKRFFLRLAELSRKKIGYPESFAILATLLVTFYAFFKFKRTIAGASFVEQSSEEPEIVYERTDARPPKSNGHEKELTWVVNDKKLSSLDLTPTIMSSKQFDREKFIEIISRNVVRIIIYDISTPKARFINSAIVVKSNILLCNAHFFANVKNDSFKMILVCDEIGGGVNDKIEITYHKKDIFFDCSRDSAIFTVHSLVPRKDITRYFGKQGLYTRATGSLLSRHPTSGVLQINTVFDVTLQDNYTDSWGRYPYLGPVTMGTSKDLTVDGDCGSMLILHTPKGHVVSGFHRAGNINKGIIGVLIYSDYLDLLLSQTNSLAVSAGTPHLLPEHTQIQSLHPKSVFNFIPEGSAQVMGSISSYKSNTKSRVCPTLMRDCFVKRGYSVSHVPPILKGYQPYYLAGIDLVDPITSFDTSLLATCANSFYNDIIDVVPQSDIELMVHKYDLFTAINGAKGVAYVDGINRSTSAGYPYCTSKRKYLVDLPPDRGLSEPVMINDDIKGEIDYFLDSYSRGERAHPVFVGTLKDEPVSFEKRSLSKTRLFGCAPLSYVLIQRMYFLSSIRLMQTHKMAFESAVGIIAQTREWELFHNKMSRFSNCFAGDFSKFDKKMCPLVILLAYDILIKIAERSGNYTGEDISVMRGIATDTAYPFMLFNGDFVQLFGSNPSGHSLTVIINSLVNCIYLRYVFVVLYKENIDSVESDDDIVVKFKGYVEDFVYGDDNQGCTKAEWFNFKNIQRAFASVGIKYTPPTKDDSDYNFVTIDEIDFLKRSYKYDSDLDAVVAPLTHESINRMLTTWVASDTISPEAQAVDVMSSAIREYFFYGKDTFEEKRRVFIDVFKELNLEHCINTTVLPTYDMLRERYEEASQKVLSRLPNHSFGFTYKEQSGVLVVSAATPMWAFVASDMQQLIYIICFFIYYFIFSAYFIRGVVYYYFGMLHPREVWQLKLFPLFLMIHILQFEEAILMLYILNKVRVL